ncbi:hypothetical protein [Streptomyces kronopolitis]
MVEPESLTPVVRQVMELRRETVVDLAGELAAGDPVVQLAASLGVDPASGRPVFVDRWAAVTVLTGA